MAELALSHRHCGWLRARRKPPRGRAADRPDPDRGHGTAAFRLRLPSALSGACNRSRTSPRRTSRRRAAGDLGDDMFHLYFLPANAPTVLNKRLGAAAAAFGVAVLAGYGFLSASLEHLNT